MGKAATSVLEVLDAVKIEDVEREIAEVEAALEAATSEHTKKLDSLRELLRVLKFKRDGRPQRAARGSKKAAKAAKAAAKSAAAQNDDEDDDPEPVATPTKALMGGTGLVHPADKLGDRIREHLRLYGRKTPQELVKALGVDYSKVYKELQRDMRVEKDANGRYGAKQ